MTDAQMATNLPQLLLAPHTAQQVSTALKSGVFVGGWLITGAPHIGKARLATGIAVAALSGASELGAGDAETKRLVVNGSHPDFFILSRQVNEKTGRLKNDIVVDDIRSMIDRLQRTSTTGRRVVIIDLADHLNREAANALLKILEEPPANTLMLLLSIAPGRLLPTIRSRCRKLAMMPTEEGALTSWLMEQKNLDSQQALKIVQQSNGRPGRAILLTDGNNEKARELSDGLLNAVFSGGDVVSAAHALGARDADEIWEDALSLLINRIEDTIIAHAQGRQSDLRPPLNSISIGQLLFALDNMKNSISRAKRLNSDRTHTALFTGISLQNMKRDQHAS